MKGQYEVLSPWAEADSMLVRSISPRLEDLNNKTIGLFCSKYKVASLSILKTVERKLKEKFPTLKFSLFARADANFFSSSTSRTFILRPLLYIDGERHSKGRTFTGTAHHGYLAL